MDTKLLEKKMESISPFELKNRLIDMADESSSCWEASAWKSAAASWICPRELQASPKKKALPLASKPS